MSALAMALAVAAVTAVVQVWIKAVARQPPPGKAFHFMREDSVLWIEWVGSGAVSLALMAIVAANNSQSLKPFQTYTALFAMAVACGPLPLILRGFLYDPASGQLKDWRRIWLANIAGLVILLAAIAAGADVNAK